MQALTGTPWLKRMPCLIIARHPQTPREVTVVCKQISGTLLLQDVRQELRIRSHTEGNPVLSPADFEAAAGCSKGKNWKVRCTWQELASTADLRSDVTVLYTCLTALHWQPRKQ